MKIIISIFVFTFVSYYNYQSTAIDRISSHDNEFIINCPVDSGRITTKFGDKKHPVLNISKFHPGIDIASPFGRKVYSVEDGFISYLGDNKSYGVTIHVHHDSIFTSTYSHLSKILIDKGEKVKKGEVIGLVGDTGLVTAPHLHFELHENGKPVDPEKYMECDKIKFNPRLSD